MNGETHRQLAGFIWSLCNLRRGQYTRNGYHFLLLTVLRRFECLLTSTTAVAGRIDGRQAWFKEIAT